MAIQRTFHSTSSIFRLHNLITTDSPQHNFIMLVSLLALGLAAFASAVPTVEPFERDNPSLDDVYIKHITYAGTGCPTKDSVQNYTSADKQT